MTPLFPALSLIFLIIVMSSNVYASFAAEVHESPIRTNVNEVSGEFESNIPDKATLDANVEALRLDGVRGIESPNMDYLLAPVDRTKLSSESSRLSAVNEYDLEYEGRRERMKEENAYFNDFETDYTKPGALPHKRDAEEIVSATERKFRELTRTLNDIGVDCREAQRERAIKDPYLLEVSRREVKEVDYDKVLCEHLSNNYNCTSSLKATCRHKFSVPLEESSFSTSLPKSYDSRTGVLTFGWPHNFTQVGGKGTQYDYRINFRIDALEAVNEFILKEVGYDDFVRITVNGYQVFVGPFGGDRLELRKDKTVFTDSYRGFPFYGVAIDGSGTIHCADQFEWRLAHANIDVRRFLREGSNYIDVRLIVGGGGGIWLKFTAKVNGCNSWTETWEEQCTHKK